MAFVFFFLLSAPPFPPGFFLSNAVGWKLNWWFTESKEDGEKSLGYEEKD